MLCTFLTPIKKFHQYNGYKKATSLNDESVHLDFVEPIYQKLASNRRLYDQVVLTHLEQKNFASSQYERVICFVSLHPNE